MRRFFFHNWKGEVFLSTETHITKVQISIGQYYRAFFFLQKNNMITEKSYTHGVTPKCNLFIYSSVPTYLFAYITPKMHCNTAWLIGLNRMKFSGA